LPSTGSGARTDAIARAAHVNKALLYYYFKDKDALYEAVMDHVFGGCGTGDAGAGKRTGSAQKMLEYVAAYYDYIAANRVSAVVQAEWMRPGADRRACSAWLGNISVRSLRRCWGFAVGD